MSRLLLLGFAIILFWILYEIMSALKRIMDKEEPDHQPMSPDQIQNNLFDCPFCLLPAEAIALVIQSDGTDMSFQYIAECLGNHQPFKVDPHWLEEELTNPA